MTASDCRSASAGLWVDLAILSTKKRVEAISGPDAPESQTTNHLWALPCASSPLLSFPKCKTRATSLQSSHSRLERQKAGDNQRLLRVSRPIQRGEPRRSRPADGAKLPRRIWTSTRFEGENPELRAVSL